jgi:hypothetical protein
MVYLRKKESVWLKGGYNKLTVTQQDNALTEMEVKVLIQSRKKSIDEIAANLGIDVAQVSKILEQANQKLSKESVPALNEIPFLPRPKAFKLEKKIGQPQIGTMKVGSQIVEILSKGIYSAPWNSIKELINNSFDADASEVKIDYYPSDNRLVILDNGKGMDYTDFDEHFTFIVRSLKREKGVFSEKFRRPLIGKIGIGFVAVSELCDKIKVTSAKEGADTVVEATIDFGKIRSVESKKKEFYEISQFTVINYEKKDINEHYTKMELLDLKKPFVEILESKNHPNLGLTAFMAKTIDDLMDRIGDDNIPSIKNDLGQYWEFIFNLALVIPIEYAERGPVLELNESSIPEELISDYRKAIKIIEERKKTLREYKFKVFFNGLQLKKPISFPNEKIVKNGKYGKDYRIFPIDMSIKLTENGESAVIALKGFYYYQKTRIIPQELRGLIVRIKNVAIGSPSLDFWGHPFTGDTVYLPQTFGEIYFDSGLEDAMNIDRSTFKTTHEEYAFVRKYLNEFQRDNIFAEAKKMYYARRDDRGSNFEREVNNSRVAAARTSLGARYEIHEIRKMSDQPVTVDNEKKSIIVNSRSELLEGFEKSDRLLLQDVAMAIEIATNKAKTVPEVKEIFWKVLRDATGYRR